MFLLFSFVSKEAVLVWGLLGYAIVYQTNDPTRPDTGPLGLTANRDVPDRPACRNRGQARHAVLVAVPGRAVNMSTLSN